MSTDILNSESTEYKYNIKDRYEYIYNKYFLAILKVAKINNKYDYFKELIINSKWSKLIDEIDKEIKKYSNINTDFYDEDLVIALLEERDNIKGFYLTAFIELDEKFNNYSEKVLKNILKWADNFRIIYTKDFIVDELEDYYLRLHNEFNLDEWVLTINNNFITMPNGDLLFGITPSKSQMAILDTILYDSNNEPYFYDIINKINNINEDKIDLIAEIALAFNYNAWINRSNDFVDILLNLEKYDNKSLNELALAITALAPEWYSHGEELLITAEKLILK
jgi:hypothetical protein